MQRVCRSPVLVSAVIWAAVIGGTAFVEPGAGARLLPLLAGGAAAHLVVLGRRG